MIIILQSFFRSLLSKLSYRKNVLSGSTSSDWIIGAEAPIATFKEDRLRRNTYAEHVAKILMAPEPKVGRVFAIRGGWGYGKSSLKKLIIAHIEQHHKHGYVDFNPWQWGDSDTIVRELFSQVADVLGGEYSKKEKERAEKFRRLGNLLSGASDPLKQASKSEDAIASVLTNLSLITIAASIGFKISTPENVAIIVSILSGLSILAKVAGKYLLFRGHDRSKDPIGQLRESLVKQLCEMEHPVVVFVDDLDRLEPKQIQLLISQIKTNANLPNIVFVLLFQASIVEAALDPIANGNGRAFLEKIVQANFDLPAVPISAVHSIFYEEISQLLGSYASKANGFYLPLWFDVSKKCVLPMIRNLRDVRRLIFSIASNLPLHSGSQVFEVNMIDFIILEAIRVFEPVLYSALFDRKNLLIQAHPYNLKGSDELSKSEVQILIQVVAEDRQTLAKNIIQELFPSVGWALGGNRYDDAKRQQDFNEKRVCTALYFPRYFELQTPVGDVSDSRMQEVIQSLDSKENFAAAIASLKEEGLLGSFVSQLDQREITNLLEQAAIFIPAMFEIGQKLAADGANSLNMAYFTAGKVTNKYLLKIPLEQRKELAVQALQETQGMDFVAYLIYLGEQAIIPVLDVETVNALKSEWLHQIRDMAKNTDLLLSDLRLETLLRLWRAYSGSLREPQLWVEELINKDDRFATFVFRLMRVLNPTPPSTVHYQFDKQFIVDFIGLVVAKTKCDAIRLTESDERAIALRLLSENLNDWIHQDAKASS